LGAVHLAILPFLLFSSVALVVKAEPMKMADIPVAAVMGAVLL
jgi:hypothetical protein